MSLILFETRLVRAIALLNKSSSEFYVLFSYVLGATLSILNRE